MLNDKSEVNNEKSLDRFTDTENIETKVYNENESCRCDTDDISVLVKRSFELDNLVIMTKVMSDPLQDRAVGILQSTTRRINHNTWEAGLLWQSDDVSLPDEKYSYNMAIKRCQILDKKLKGDSKLGKAYTEEMNRLFHKKYAVVYHAQPQQQNVNNNKSWFLPHFAVVNPNKPGKVRPVFDAAAKTVGTSLNEKLLLRFRLKRIGVSADIRDMFLRIKIKEEDQEAQKFLWCEPTESGTPKVCKMTSKLVGATCSPSSAIYAKDTNASQFEKDYPESVKAIKRSHYVHDYLDSLDTEHEAIQRATESIIYIHSQGGFDIRSWASNSEAVLKAIPEEKRAHENIDLTPEAGQKNKTLGMVWEPATDTLTFNTSMRAIEYLLRLASNISHTDDTDTEHNSTLVDTFREPIPPPPPTKKKKIAQLSRMVSQLKEIADTTNSTVEENE